MKDVIIQGLLYIAAGLFVGLVFAAVAALIGLIVALWRGEDAKATIKRFVVYVLKHYDF